MTPQDLTPIEEYDGIFVKRDDLFEFAGCYGGKVRTCLVIGQKAKQSGIEGLTTAASRESPQAKITASVAHALGLKARCHIPATSKPLDQNMITAQNLGAELVFHRPGYNSVLKCRSRADAQSRHWSDVPFGMECTEAIIQNSLQTSNIPKEVRRIIITVGSGATVSGVLTGLRKNGFNIPVLGIAVGSNPLRLLNTYVFGWQRHLTLLRSKKSYHDKVIASICGIELDQIYEAKAVQYVKPGDLFWITGRR